MPVSPSEDNLPLLTAVGVDEAELEEMREAAQSGVAVFVRVHVDANLRAQGGVGDDCILEVPSLGGAGPRARFRASVLGPESESGWLLRLAVVANANANASPRASESDPRAPALIGRAIAGGKFVIESPIGAGGMGALFRARHRDLGMFVAVKVLKPAFQNDDEFARRFYAEAVAASGLDHPNLTRVIDFGTEPDGLLYLVMEFIAGVNLRDVLQKHGVLPLRRLVDVMMQTCAGLSHAHEHGVLHRDIKPDNILLVVGVNDDGQATERVKVCDFGLAQARARAASSSQAHALAGTPAYMCPEQVSGGLFDARSDVYACGVTLYEMATGFLPFEAADPRETLRLHRDVEPIAPSLLQPAIDRRLEQIIVRALAKDPNARQQSMRELRADLRALIEPAAAPDVGRRHEPAVPEVSPRTDGNSHRGHPGHDSESRRAAAKPVGTPALASTPASDPSVPLPPVPELRARDPRQPPSSPRMPAAAGVSGLAVRSGAAKETGSGVFRLPSREDAAPSGRASVAHRADAIGLNALADELQKNAGPWLERFLSERDMFAFSKYARQLERAITELVDVGAFRSLWAVSIALSGLVAEGPTAPGTRGAIAHELRQRLRDPGLLAVAARHLLLGADVQREPAKRMLLDAGVAGAQSVYNARVHCAGTSSVRPIFIDVFRQFGRTGWPVVRAVLDRIIAGSETHNALTLDLAVDLLHVATGVGGAAAAAEVARFLTVSDVHVLRAAAEGTARLQGEASRPLLHALQSSSDPARREIATAALALLSSRVP